MPDLLAREPVRELGDPAVRAADERDVVERDGSDVIDLGVEAWEPEDLEVAGEGACEAGLDLLALRRREEAHGSEVEPEHGHARPRVDPKRLEDRAVTSEDDAQVGAPGDLLRGFEVGGALSVLFDLLGPGHQRAGRLRRRRDRLPKRESGLVRMSVGKDHNGADRRRSPHGLNAHGSSSSAEPIVSGLP